MHCAKTIYNGATSLRSFATWLKFKFSYKYDKFYIAQRTVTNMKYNGRIAGVYLPVKLCGIYFFTFKAAGRIVCKAKEFIFPTTVFKLCFKFISFFLHRVITYAYYDLFEILKRGQGNRKCSSKIYLKT